MLETDHVALSGLHGESGLDEQHRVAARTGKGMPDGHEGGEGALHASCRRHTAFGSNIHVDEGFHEVGSSLLDARYASIGRVDGGAAFCKCFSLSLESNLGWLQARYAHLQVDDLLARLLLEETGECLYVADGSLGEISQAHAVDNLFYCLSIHGEDV